MDFSFEMFTECGGRAFFSLQIDSYFYISHQAIQQHQFLKQMIFRFGSFPGPRAIWNIRVDFTSTNSLFSRNECWSILIATMSGETITIIITFIRSLFLLASSFNRFGFFFFFLVRNFLILSQIDLFRQRSTSVETILTKKRMLI